MLLWSVIVTREDSQFATGFRAKFKRIHGDRILSTRVGRYHLIHLDSPNPEQVSQRIRKYSAEKLLDQDCVFCSRRAAR